MESKLSKEKLLKLAEVPEVQEFVKEADYSFYQALVEVLVPDVLRPIPSKYSYGHLLLCSVQMVKLNS